jgi:hypothetical protein
MPFACPGFNLCTDLPVQAEAEQLSLGNARIVGGIANTQPFGRKGLSHRQPITQVDQDHQMTFSSERKCHQPLSFIPALFSKIPFWNLFWNWSFWSNNQA